MLAITGLLVMQTVDQALAGVVLPSGAGTLTIGPQAMEGNLQIHPGDTIKAGYDFTMPGAHAPAQVTVENASITMAVTCSNGATPPAITFALPVQTYNDPAGSPSWYPSGDQSNAAVYQGSISAPDLCSGGVMSDANGATFKATVFTTDTADRVNFRFHYSDNTAGSWSATATAPLTATAKTVLSATLIPSLGLTFAVDPTSAIPGDTLTYSGTVTNTGATLTLTGDFIASASGTSSATVTSYWDAVATSLDSTTWTALAGKAAASGNTAAVAAPITSGMTLTSTPVAANGVTYPATGDPLLGTTMASGSSALWHYTASVPLTPSQVATLLDPTKVKAIRNSFHLEVAPTNPNTTQPSVVNVDFSDIFFAASPAPWGAVTNITVTVQPPTGAAVTINSGTVAGLASLAPGGSATYSTTYKVPVPAVKGTGESDAAYQARLTAVEGSKLSASASASGGSSGGAVSAVAPAVSTTEHLPIISITKFGPTTPVAAGTSASYPLTLKNTGGATASGFALTDSVPSGDTGTVSGPLTSLTAGSSSSGVQATYVVPATQTPGNLTDTASVSWQDARGNVYGPVSSSFTTVIQNTLLGARLTLALAAGDAGLNAINASQTLQLTLLNSAGAPIPDQAVTVNVTGSNPTTLGAVTDSNGQASVSYGGKTPGVDQVQATASSGTTTVSSNTVSVTWINPIQPIATTPAQGSFYSESSTQATFVAKPGDTAAFQQSFPTINFNPPANTVPHNVSGVGPQTVPFTDVTTDAVGNFAGTIVAQGHGVQAGVGPLTSFDAVFTANFVMAQPGDVTFNIMADDGFMLGVGGGASRIAGTMVGAPASGITPFNGFPIVGAYNQAGGSGPATYSVTVHFPSAGPYPYELDYFECCGAQMSLTMTVASVNSAPYNLSTGYADSVRPAGTSSFPFPWNGAANTNFVGSGAPYDTGGLRFDNNSNQPITLNHVTVDIGSRHYDPWNLNQTIPANGTLILANPTGSAFDTSEAGGTATSGGSGGGSGGFVATPFATGFNTMGTSIGPIGVAFDNAGSLFVMNYQTGILYKFGPGGGVAGPATQVSANGIFGCPTSTSASSGLAFSKDGKHLYLAQQCSGQVLEVDQTTGVVIRTVASGIPYATGIATDPISGDLFVTEPSFGHDDIIRVSNPTSANPTVGPYAHPGSKSDGIAFGPDGTLYASICCSAVIIISATNSSVPGTILGYISNSALSGNDGIALLPPPPGAVGESIVVNSNFGFIVEIDNPLTANPTFHNIVTGGSRGDFVTVGPDHCLYATQTDSVEKVTSADGSCPFVPSICLTSPTVPVVHVAINGFTFDYNDSGLALTGGGSDGECTGNNESRAWQQIGGKGGPVNIPLPPAMTLALQAAPSSGHVVGQSQAFTVAAMDGAGHTVPNVAVQLGVFGANPQQPSGTTDASGTATFAYTGVNAGTDTVTATAFISGLQAVSNSVPIQWTIPAPGGPTGSTTGLAPPSVVVTAPTDGSAVSQPVPITATIRAPPSSPISSWNVLYQNVSGGSVVTLASGTGNPPATLATFDPTGLTAGTYAITVNATTADGGFASAVVRVIVGGGGGTTAQMPPTISAPSPADGTIVTKPVPITATITPPAGQTIASWSVSYQSQSQGAIVPIKSDVGSPPSPLATFDPTLLPNDTYAIIVSATASGGGTQTATTTVAVSGNLKLGRYVTSYQDLSVPVDGFQMQVQRTYDSIDKGAGDFGIGWHVDLVNFRVSANRQLGAGGWTEYPTSCIFGLCFYAFKASAPHYVTVTFPNQHQEIFDFTPKGGAGLLYWQGSAAFTARPGIGTASTLEVSGDSSLSYDFAGNLVAGSGYFSPTRFKLTTRDGGVLILDTASGLVSETDRSGNSLTVDSTGVHASSGTGITFARDASNGNRITAVTGPMGERVGYRYSGSDLSSSIDVVGNLTTYSYDGNHNMLSASAPSGPLRTLQYDANNRLVAITDPNGNITRLSNDVGVQQQVVSDPNGQLSTIYTYDNLGDTLVRQQVYGGTTAKTTTTYDTAGRPTSITDPLNRTQRMFYDSSGNMVEADDEAGNPIKFTYNAQGQPLTQLDPFGTVVAQMTYDAQGRITQEQHGTSNRTYAYDIVGHLLTATNTAGAIERFGYDSAGHISSYIDGSNVSVGIVSDAEGRVTTVSTANGAVARISYDAAGHILSLTDPAGHPQNFTYDAFGNVKIMTDMSGRTTTFSYDPAGRLLSRQNRDGSTIAYQRDAAGRVTRKSLSDGSVTTYTYDVLGRIVSATSADAVLTYGYDVANQVTAVTTAGTATWPQPTVTLTYSYDPTGNVASLSGPDGITRYVYDANHHESSLTDPAGGVFRMTYDSLGRIATLARPNGVVDSFSYDALGQLTGRDAALGPTVVARADYTYGPTGTRSSMTDLSGTTTYAHDVVGQLTGATHPGSSGLPNEAYSYDPAGNRTSSNGANGSATYDTADHLTQDALYTYAYDLDGNLLSRTNRSTGAVTSFTWNAENQLRAILFPDGTTTQYRYDPAGRRIEVNAGGSISRFVYDRANAHLQYDGANQQVLAHVASQSTDDILETTQSGTRTFYLRDALGSTTALTDGAGAVIGTNAFDSYGNPTTPGLAPWSSYAGREYDSKSGLYFNRLRTYDPGTGRFLGEDPVGAANPYPYAGGDPVDYKDPTGGTFIETALQNAFAGALVGAISNLLIQVFFSALLCQGHVVIHWGDVALSGLWGAIAGFGFTPWALAASVWTRAFAGGLVGGAASGGAYLNQSFGKYGDFNHLNGDDLLRAIGAGFAFGVVGGVYSGPGAIAVSGSKVIQTISDNAGQAVVSGVPGSAATVGLPYNCDASQLFS